MTILKTLQLPKAMQDVVSPPGVFCQLRDGKLVVYDLLSEYGDPHYPLTSFLTASKLLGLGISDHRSVHIEKKVADLFASDEALRICNITLFVYHRTQRDLKNAGISVDECKKITELFSKYGYTIEKIVSPYRKNMPYQ